MSWHQVSKCNYFRFCCMISFTFCFSYILWDILYNVSQTVEKFTNSSLLSSKGRAPVESFIRGMMEPSGAAGGTCSPWNNWSCCPDARYSFPGGSGSHKLWAWCLICSALLTLNIQRDGGKTRKFLLDLEKLVSFTSTLRVCYWKVLVLSA